MIQLVRPCRGHITQRYGNIQPDGMKHTGNDYAYYSGGQVRPEVFAAADGTVLYAGDSRALGWPNPWYFNPDFDRNDAVDSSAGNVLVLGHVQNGVPFVTTNSHLEAWSVRKGDTVRAGQHIATIGSTGRSTGKHLHFELMFKPLNFNTATYGRTDPNPYIIEGLAAQGAITPQEDELSAAEVDAIVAETNKQAEETRKQVKEALRLAVGAIAENGQAMEDVTRDYITSTTQAQSDVTRQFLTDRIREIPADEFAAATPDELVQGFLDAFAKRVAK